MNSLMSSRTIACSSSNSTSASALQSSVLPTPVGPRKMNEPIGRCGSCKPRAAAADGVGHGLDRFVLADDALVQPLFEHEQLGPLGFDQPRDRHAGPGADDLGDFFRPNFLAQQSTFADGDGTRAVRFGFDFLRQRAFGAHRVRTAR